MRGWCALLCTLAVAGCLGGPVEPSANRSPTWYTTTSEPLVALSTGCGFCHGMPDHPESNTTVVYEDGKVLWFENSISTKDGSRLNMTPGTEKHRSEILELLPHVPENGYLKRDVTVHRVRSGTVSSSDWDGIQDLYEAALREVRDPGEPEYNCSDCGGIYVSTFGANAMEAEFPWQSKKPPAWDDIIEQTLVLRTWIDAPSD